MGFGLTSRFQFKHSTCTETVDACSRNISDYPIIELVISLFRYKYTRILKFTHGYITCRVTRLYQTKIFHNKACTSIASVDITCGIAIANNTTLSILRYKATIPLRYNISMHLHIGIAVLNQAAIGLN